MCPNFVIGLNETQVGIIAPPWLVDVFYNTISRREAERALIAGKLFSTDEAFKVRQKCKLVFWSV